MDLKDEMYTCQRSKYVQVNTNYLSKSNLRLNLDEKYI